MVSRADVARAIAFFETSDDGILLHQITAEIAPRVRRIVTRLLQQRGEDAIPPPATLSPPATPASQDEALATLRQVGDFALLQALARAIGQRIETLEIAASAQFPEGARVHVPSRPDFPPPETTLSGTVEATGTMLRVRLDNGQYWEGPPSLARLRHT